MSALLQLSDFVRKTVRSEPHQGRSEFLATLKTEFPDFPYPVIFTDLIPCDMLAFNSDTLIVVMSIDYRTAGNYSLIGD